MNKKLRVFLIRAGLGLLGGWFLTGVFFRRGGWPLILFLAVLVVAAAYVSEAWRIKRRP